MNYSALFILAFFLLGYIGGVNAVTFPNTIEWIPSGGGTITFQEGFNSSNATVGDLILFKDFTCGKAKYNMIGWSLDAGSSMVVNSVSDTEVRMTLNIFGESGTLTIFIPEKTIVTIDGVNSWTWENGYVVVTVGGSMLLSSVPIIVHLLGGVGGGGGISYWLIMVAAAAVLLFMLSRR